MREAQNPYYENCVEIVKYMQEISKLTNREYKPFSYYGSSEARHIIVSMGSSCEAIMETVDFK